MSHVQSITQLTTFADECQKKTDQNTIESNLAAMGRLPLVPGADRSLGIYVHIPFCFHKCHYCDFYSIVDHRDRQGAFTARLVAELEHSAALLRAAQPQTIFIGGGTPTLLAASCWKRFLAAVDRHWRGCGLREFTVEANPETVTSELALLLAAGGVDRISIGAQSFNSATLRMLERWHDPPSVARSIDHFHKAGITNINVDLIFGVPGQSLDDWRIDLEAALDLEPTHLSCYSLMYEPNTPLTKKLQRGRITPIEEDLEAAMYELTMDRLADAGFEHYEVSAWARPGARCRHNMIYWANQDWWPLGPSASGHLDGLRWKNVPRLAEYLECKPLPAITDVEELDVDGRVGETLMLGLRLRDGIDQASLNVLLGVGARSGARQASIERAMEAGLLELSCGRLHLSRRGLLVADSILSELI